MLQDTYPQADFQVITAAMAAINSHLEEQARADDSNLETVYRHFHRNLRDSFALPIRQSKYAAKDCVIHRIVPYCTAIWVLFLRNKDARIRRSRKFRPLCRLTLILPGFAGSLKRYPKAVRLGPAAFFRHGFTRIHTVEAQPQYPARGRILRRVYPRPKRRAQRTLCVEKAFC
jgi:hypothetical protein